MGFSFGGHQVALIGGQAYCAACNSTGVIAKAGGPYRLGFSGMGEVALDRDIVRCHCPTPPTIVASLADEAWCDDEIEKHGAASDPSGLGSAGSVNASEQSQAPELEHYLEIVHADTGAPIDGFTYKIMSGESAVISDAPLTGGKTSALSLAEHPDVTLVAWRPMDKR
jgi:hypothetical protein